MDRGFRFRKLYGVCASRIETKNRGARLHSLLLSFFSFFISMRSGSGRSPSGHYTILIRTTRHYLPPASAFITTPLLQSKSTPDPSPSPQQPSHPLTHFYFPPLLQATKLNTALPAKAAKANQMNAVSALASLHRSPKLTVGLTLPARSMPPFVMTLCVV